MAPCTLCLPGLLLGSLVSHAGWASLGAEGRGSSREVMSARARAVPVCTEIGVLREDGAERSSSPCGVILGAARPSLTILRKLGGPWGKWEGLQNIQEGGAA